MLNLDGTIRVLSPELDPVQPIREYVLSVMQERVLSQLSPGRVFAWVLDMKHLVENSLRRAGVILDKLANDRFALVSPESPLLLFSSSPLARLREWTAMKEPSGVQGAEAPCRGVGCPHKIYPPFFHPRW